MHLNNTFNVSSDFLVPAVCFHLKVTEDGDSAEMLPRDYDHPQCEAYSYAAQIPQPSEH